MIDIIIQDAITSKAYMFQVKTYNIKNQNSELEKCIHVKELQTKLATLIDTHPRYISIIFYRYIPRTNEYLNLNSVYNETLRFIHIKRYDWENRKSAILYRFCNRRNQNLGD
jgi:hypothetical protein